MREEVEAEVGTRFEVRCNVILFQYLSVSSFLCALPRLFFSFFTGVLCFLILGLVGISVFPLLCSATVSCISSLIFPL